MSIRSVCLSLFAGLAVTTSLASKPMHIQIVSHIQRTHIQSSALRAVGYSKRRHILEIEFVNGAIYRYYDVDPFVYREFMNADSKARYYDFNIRRKYLSARVKPRVIDHVAK